MRTSEFFVTKNSRFFEKLLCDRTEKEEGGLKQWTFCGQGKRRSNFGDFVRTSLMDGPNFIHLKYLPTCWLKARVQCFTMQVVMNKCFILNHTLLKVWDRSVLSFSRKMQKPLNCNTLLFRKNDVTKPKARLLQ